MSTECPDPDSIAQRRSQQNIHDVSANNGSFLFAGDVSHVSISQPGKTASSFEDAIKKCRDVLFVSHPDANRASISDAKGQRAPGTYQWIMQNSHYKAWLDKKYPLFWISGGPGTGKTAMSLFLSEQVERLCQGTDNQFLFYFCRFQHESYNKPENLLRSLIYQLLNFSTDMSKVSEVFSYLDTEEKAKSALSSLECLWKILEILLSQSDLSTVYCIVDGVDECQSSDVLACKFRDYCSSPTGRNGPLRLALVGRDLDVLGIATHSRGPSRSSGSTLERTFAETGAINLINGIKLDPDHGGNVNNDIAIFTRWSLGFLKRIDGFEAIHGHVEEVLLNRAEGTFLWVSFVIHELSQKRTCLQILETIQDIPAGLHPIFGRMLHQIDPKYRHISAIIFKWLAIAMRPLTLRELACALGSDIEGMADRIAICQLLLKLDDDLVLFVHQSACECILREQPDEDPVAEGFRMDASKCHGEIAHRCLQILQNSFSQHTIPSFFGSYRESIEIDHRESDTTGRDKLPAELRTVSALFHYAYSHCMKHARLSPRDAEYLFDYSRPFLKKSSEIRRNWARSRGAPQRRLHMASYFGIIPWLQALLEEGDSLTFYGTRRWKRWANSTWHLDTALKYAVGSDLEEAVRFLLQHDADMGNGEYSALWDAARLGRGKIVQILLEHGAKIIENSRDRSVLITAAREGFIHVVRLLLDHGADINIRNDENETALIMAAKYAHDDLFMLLLDHGAHLDVADFRVWLRRTALITWSRWSTRVVQTFLRRVTNICWEGEDGSRLLNLAAAADDYEMVRVCLAKGVDVNWEHPNGRTALIAAVWENESRDPSGSYLVWDGHHTKKNQDPRVIADRCAIVEVLLQHGADPNLCANCDDGLREPEPRMGLLSLFGRFLPEPDVEPRFEGGSALVDATKLGHVSIVRLLLAYGADTGLVDEYGKTALEWACRRGYREIEQVLMEHDGTLCRSLP